MRAFQLFKILKRNVGKLISAMPLTEEIMHTQFHDKVDGYKTLDYTNNSYKQEEIKETLNNLYKISFDFETITSAPKHMPYSCWLYNDDIQQECIGINTCAVDVLSAVPTGKHEITLIAHNSDYDCRSVLEY